MEAKHINYKAYVISGITAAVLGVGVSFIVNSTLAEISTNPYFALYFGLLFIIFGAAISYRTYSHAVLDSRRKTFLAFGILIMISGLLCFILEKNWFVGLKPHFKIPLYGILGISVSYALTFALVDLINYIISYCKSYNHSAIENTEQIISVVVCSVIMGGAFGIIFGIMDYEDEEKYHKQLDLMKEELYCYPIGGVIGLVCGCVNEYLRKDYVKQNDSFEDEI